MSEEQVYSITISGDDLSNHNTGGAYRTHKVSVVVDTSLPFHRQKECIIHEVMGVYLGSVVNTEDLGEIAEAINLALVDLERLNDYNKN